MNVLPLLESSLVLQFTTPSTLVQQLWKHCEGDTKHWRHTFVQSVRTWLHAPFGDRGQGANRSTRTAKQRYALALEKQQWFDPHSDPGRIVSPLPFPHHLDT
mmetsp:Transcript_7783/g.16252  ORF Transcript_7783/g.16252 Transcript_7783/m.16252 type:complete len:102 (+) Transcript_7783:421-726(+)